MPEPSAEEITRLTNRAIRYLSFRSRSHKEITDYLVKQAPGSQDVVKSVTARLTELALINDQQFAQYWLENRLETGKGPLLITAELKQKGIHPDLINQIMVETDISTWIESALKLIKRKQVSLKSPSDYQGKAKIYRLLSRRGFTSAIIYPVIDAIGGE